MGRILANPPPPPTPNPIRPIPSHVLLLASPPNPLLHPPQSGRHMHMRITQVVPRLFIQWSSLSSLWAHIIVLIAWILECFYYWYFEWIMGTNWKCLVTCSHSVLAFLWILIFLGRGIEASANYWKFMFLHYRRCDKFLLTVWWIFPWIID